MSGKIRDSTWTVQFVPVITALTGPTLTSQSSWLLEFA